MAVEDMFELRAEFQDLIVDVALTIPCGCLDAYRRSLESGSSSPAACLGCRARYVMHLGRRLRGWSPLPAIGVAHVAGPAFRSMQWFPRRRPQLRAVGGRQACTRCGEVLKSGPIAAHPYDEGELVVRYVARTTSLGRLHGVGLTARDARQGEPGHIPCDAINELKPLFIVDVERSPGAARGFAQGFQQDAGP